MPAVVASARGVGLRFSRRFFSRIAAPLIVVIVLVGVSVVLTSFPVKGQRLHIVYDASSTSRATGLSRFQPSATIIWRGKTSSDAEPGKAKRALLGTVSVLSTAETRQMTVR